jgi:hypothetical protein
VVRGAPFPVRGTPCRLPALHPALRVAASGAVRQEEAAKGPRDGRDRRLIRAKPRAFRFVGPRKVDFKAKPPERYPFPERKARRGVSAPAMAKGRRGFGRNLGIPETTGLRNAAAYGFSGRL